MAADAKRLARRDLYTVLTASRLYSKFSAVLISAQLALAAETTRVTVELKGLESMEDWGNCQAKTADLAITPE